MWLSLVYFFPTKKMEIIKINFENTALGTEYACNFCARMQLGFVLVLHLYLFYDIVLAYDQKYNYDFSTLIFLYFI